MGTIAIRVDGNSEVGAGHLIRCLALAAQLRALSREVIFIGREGKGSLSHLVEMAGFRWINLDTCRHNSTSHLDVFEEEDDAKTTLCAIEQLSSNVDWMIVDHYGIGIHWERTLRKAVRKVLVIDDLANRQHDCDILLDQNFVENANTRYMALVPPGTRLLIGPRYALLRSQFIERAHSSQKRKYNKVRKIVVSFGGADLPNATGRVLQAIARLDLSDVCIDVIIGAANPHSETLKIASKLFLPGQVRLHVDIDNMAELLDEADIAIGAGGVSNWERFCLGVPSLVITLAENQVAGARALGCAGYCLYIGRLDQITDDQIAAAISVLVTSDSLRSSLFYSSARLVDGAGAIRVAAELAAKQICLRRAVMSDAYITHEWRNANESRRYSRDSRTIPFDEHLIWFEKSLSSGERVLLIAESNGEPVGVLRYDLRDGTAETSIYLAPDKYGQGIGQRVLREGCLWLKSNTPGISRVVADVKAENSRSAHAFLAAGFKHVIDRFEATLC